MNPTTRESDPLIEFYETDYPWPEDSCYGQMTDTLSLTLTRDIDFVAELAEGTSGPILDLCAGTGRLSVPLARSGRDVVAVEISGRQIERYADRLRREAPDVGERVRLVRGDICEVDLGFKTEFAFIGFNSLGCIANRAAQLAALRNAAAHLAPGGRLLIDMPNAFQDALGGLFFLRPHMMRADATTGRRYMRVSLAGPTDIDQTAHIYGWYDEMLADDTVKRWMFWMRFRHLFKSELQFMVEAAGLEVVDVFGNYDRSRCEHQSLKMLMVARRPT